MHHLAAPMRRRESERGNPAFVLIGLPFLLTLGVTAFLVIAR